jgi:hypothetical protein
MNRVILKDPGLARYWDQHVLQRLAEATAHPFSSRMKLADETDSITSVNWQDIHDLRFELHNGVKYRFDLMVHYDWSQTNGTDLKLDPGSGSISSVYAVSEYIPQAGTAPLGVVDCSTDITGSFLSMLTGGGTVYSMHAAGVLLCDAVDTVLAIQMRKTSGATGQVQIRCGTYFKVWPIQNMATRSG